MRLYAEKQACPRRRNPTTLKTVLSCRQSERDGKAFWDAEQSDCHPPSCERTRIASQPLCPRKSRVCTLGTRKGRRRDGETGGGGRPDLDLDALMAHQLDAGPSVVPTTPVTEDEWVQAQRPMDATAHSPGAASGWCCPAIDTARAGDRDGNYGDFPHRRRAGSHRLLCVAHGHEAPGQRDSAASHLAGEESLDQRSGPLSRAGPPEGEHSPRQEPCAMGQAGWQKQTRWCAAELAQADGPAPGARSRSIDRRCARLLGKPGA